jgi:hypothetical protein
MENVQGSELAYTAADTQSKDESTRGGTEEPDEPDDNISALGTLSIAPDGRSTFFGPTAVSEVRTYRVFSLLGCPNADCALQGLSIQVP